MAHTSENMARSVSFQEAYDENDTQKKFLAQRTELCTQRGISSTLSALPVLNMDLFAQVKQASIRLYAYTNRFISQISRYLTNRNVVFALFNSDAYLLKLYGDKNRLEELSSIHLQRMSDWCENAIGPTAVSIGLSLNQPCITKGKENYQEILSEYAICFAPCALDNGSIANTYLMMGGIAMIIPLADMHPDYLMTTVALASDIVLHMFMSESLHKLYYSDEHGMLTIDKNIYTGNAAIIYYSDNIFKIFDIPHENLYFRKIESLFDPLPDNRRFWTILEEKERVIKQSIELTIEGRTNNYIITTEPYQQSNLAISGIRFFITSPRNLITRISQATGNNALHTFNDIIGHSPAISRVIRQAKAIANADGNVLIIGEDGTGKDIFAQAIHNESSRKGHPYFTVNCASIPRDMLSSVLFGYQPGSVAFSPASSNIGCLELANTGTLYLDNIDEIPLDLQALLLSTVEKRSFRKAGSQLATASDIRIIASTKKNLNDLVLKQKFRSDLYYQLISLHITLPPLRERDNDIISLAESFLKDPRWNSGSTRDIVLSNDTKRLLMKLPWKGNVLELYNLINGIMQINPFITIIEPQHIIDYMSDGGELPEDYESYRKYVPSGKHKLTREILENALKANGYNKKKTAEKLGISRRTIYRYLEKYAIPDLEAAPSDSGSSL